jgi:hypothetical protein
VEDVVDGEDGEDDDDASEKPSEAVEHEEGDDEEGDDEEDGDESEEEAEAKPPEPPPPEEDEESRQARLAVAHLVTAELQHGPDEFAEARRKVFDPNAVAKARETFFVLGFAVLGERHLLLLSCSPLDAA